MTFELTQGFELNRVGLLTIGDTYWSVLYSGEEEMGRVRMSVQDIYVSNSLCVEFLPHTISIPLLESGATRMDIEDDDHNVIMSSEGPAVTAGSHISIASPIRIGV